MKSILSIAAIGLCAQLSAKPRPNILWLTFEDTSPHFIGCYGNEQAHTPNIDKLAQEGVRYTGAFSTASVSSPSRFCLITGIRANSMGTGNHRSNYAIPDYIHGFPYYLRQAGYYTTNNSKTDYNLANAKPFIAESWNESSVNAGWWNRKPGQPFFAIYNSMASHQSRTMTSKWDKYESEVLNKLTKDETLQAGNLEMPSFYRNSPEMQLQISRVYNSISLMDKEFGEWLSRLEKEGLRDSTIIFCFSDHGQGLPRFKGSALASGYQVPFIAWFPPMYRHLSPGGEGVVTNDLVSFEDMAPTMLTLAGLPIPNYMKGHVFAGRKGIEPKKYVFSSTDRTDESSELSRSVTDGRYLYTKVFMPFQPFVRWNMYYDMSDIQKQIRADYQAGLLNPMQKLMLEPRRAEYLFDLKNDKWETNNLIGDKALSAKVAELRAVLKKNLINERDAHFMTEYAFQSQNKAPYLLASNRSDYPINRIVDAAFLTGEGRGVVKNQLSLLNDSNPYVRYWAAIGVFSQNQLSATDLRHIANTVKAETFAPTRNVLWLTLYKMSDSNHYIRELKALINEQNPELLRMSLHLLFTLNNDKQNALLDDIQMRYNALISHKTKKMFASSEQLKLLLYIHGKQQIESDE